MGAVMKESQIPILVEYLATNFGPVTLTDEASLPGGEGKTLVENSCTSCHGLEQVTKNHRTRKAWEEMVTSMIAAGAKVKEAEIPVLVDYLAKNFGPVTPAQ